MAMPEMQKAISNLRILLSEVRRKEDEFEGLVRQFKRQLQRAPRHAIQGGNPVETTLNMMGEIQERLDKVETMQKHLSAMKRQAENELQALSITGKIEQAKRELASMRSSRASGEDEQIEKVAELERFIEEESARAGEAITDNFNAPEL
ncbi:MAG: hypothetical protein IIC83_00875 [Chloroflexi bacterium]|nr:hypothetical protein [Chloroflexota bacterium]